MYTVRKTPRTLCCILAFLLLVCQVPRVHAAEKEDKQEENNAILAPYFIIQGKEGSTSQADQFPLKSTDVSANISGMIAETYDPDLCQ